MDQTTGAGHGHFAIFDASSGDQVIGVRADNVVDARSGHTIIVNPPFSQVIFDRDGRTVFASSSYGLVLAFDVPTQTIVNVLWHLPKVLGADFRDCTGLNSDFATQLTLYGAVV